MSTNWSADRHLASYLYSESLEAGKNKHRTGNHRHKTGKYMHETDEQAKPSNH